MVFGGKYFDDVILFLNDVIKFAKFVSNLIVHIA